MRGKRKGVHAVRDAHMEHPRVCGENLIGWIRGIMFIGTSPRMRGKPDWVALTAQKYRNIPAYAGKTKLCLSVNVLYDGTSPRMRGKLRTFELSARQQRNIPAYAGKTSGRSPRHQSAQEHPRVCGENHQHRRRRRKYVGTSPRMRGKRHSHHRRKCRRRNIPAYAGKTPPDTTTSNLTTEHPRVCGENC